MKRISLLIISIFSLTLAACGDYQNEDHWAQDQFEEERSVVLESVPLPDDVIAVFFLQFQDRGTELEARQRIMKMVAVKEETEAYHVIDLDLETGEVILVGPSNNISPLSWEEDFYYFKPFGHIGLHRIVPVENRIPGVVIESDEYVWVMNEKEWALEMRYRK